MELRCKSPQKTSTAHAYVQSAKLNTLAAITEFALTAKNTDQNHLMVKNYDQTIQRMGQLRSKDSLHKENADVGAPKPSTGDNRTEAREQKAKV
jgi:hypothetical protein